MSLENGQEAKPEPKASSVSDSFDQFTEATFQLVDAGATAAQKAIGEFTGYVFQGGLRLLATSLQSVAADPSKGRSVVDDLVTLAPVVGSTKLYADAWAKYHKGSESGDAEMVKDSKRECLLALVSAGVDVGTLGASAFVRAGFRTLIAGATAAHFLSGIESVKREVLNPLADQALANETVLKVVDSMLTSIEPGKKAEN